MTVKRPIEAVIPYIHFLEGMSSQEKERDESRYSEAKTGKRGEVLHWASPSKCRTVEDNLPPPPLLPSSGNCLSVPERKTTHSRPTYTECVPQDSLQ